MDTEQEKARFCLFFPENSYTTGSRIDYLLLLQQVNAMQTLATASRRIAPLSVKLEAHEKEQLAEIAREKSRSVHFLLCEAVREYMEREQARLAFNRESHDPWDHYQQTGLHVTEDEMDAWMDNLYTDKETPLPVCHT
jgi:predicted transcriptional regulator